jgi:dolichol kinase
MPAVTSSASPHARRSEVSHAAAAPADAASPPRGLARLSPTERRRRLTHILPGFLPFLLWFFPHRDPISPTLRWIMVGIIVVLAGRAFLQYRRIARTGDAERLGAVLGYAVSILVTLLAFPAHAELGLTVLAVLAFGDGAATLGGLLLGGPRLPWNPNKTWAGFFSFLIVGTPLASVIYWGETYFNPEALPPGSVPFAIALACGGAATFCAAIVESIPSRINDNIRVGLTSGITVALAHAALVGWN